MIVARIRLKNFRNHADSMFEFGCGINALLGSNGQGKTNVLEGISYLSLTKSFYASTDATALKMGEASFEIEGDIVTATGTSASVHVGYLASSQEKEFTINRNRPETLASVIGRFPIVILSPEKNSITFGGPAERRRFIDLLLSQCSAAYFQDLLEYRRVLRQRNRILLDAKHQGWLDRTLIEPWTAELVRFGGRIIDRRRSFVSEFLPYVRDAYADLAGADERPDIRYLSSVALDDGDRAVSDGMARQIEAKSGEEQRRGVSLVGPHRDEFGFSINGTDLQQYASQGQHKTFLVALKVAEFFFLRGRSGESPILLLDDVFSELDDARCRRILEIAMGLGQSFITTTSGSVFRGIVEWDADHRRFFIEHGTCRAA